MHADRELFRPSRNLHIRRNGVRTSINQKGTILCTLLLQHAARASNVVFKGGTCLAKVHAEFYRLSKDMDFAVPVLTAATRGTARRLAEPFRRIVQALPAPFHVSDSMKGHNNSTQYNGAVSYPSLLDGHEEPILLELSLREPLLMPATPAGARTLLRDPVTGKRHVFAADGGMHRQGRDIRRKIPRKRCRGVKWPFAISST